MRVGEETGSRPPERIGTPISWVRGFAVVLYIGAAVLAVIGLYLLSTTCWRSSIFALDDGATSGCRTQGAAQALYPLLLAQVLAVAGFVVFRWVPRRVQARGVVGSEQESAARPATTSVPRVSIAVALAVLLVGVGGVSLYVGVFSVGYTCVADVGCNTRTVTVGMLLVIFGEVLGVAGFLAARWALAVAT
ncbi:MAG: hypothetical protein GXP36_01460 [Actinobacteria bacterium]|nr:hypothetical protein [Actinomycetota bacterium]